MSKELLVRHCKEDQKYIYISEVESADEISAVSALLSEKERVSEVLSLITNLNFAPYLAIDLRIL